MMFQPGRGSNLEKQTCLVNLELLLKRTLTMAMIPSKLRGYSRCCAQSLSTTDYEAHLAMLELLVE